MGVARRPDTDWTQHVVLVTGAAGLLGGEVARHLHAAGATVVGLDSAWPRLPESLHPEGMQRVDGDVRGFELLRELLDGQRIDTVIHLAAQTLVGPAVDDPVDTFSNNIQGTWAVLEACRLGKGVTSVVVASSDKAYGDWAGRPYREDMALRARHPYDVSKAAADMLAQAYAATYSLPIAVTRCGNLYGGGDLNWSRLVPGTIRSVLEGEAPVVRSDGTLVRDYLYVGDAAGGVLSLSDAVRARDDLQGEAFNFAAEAREPVLEVVRRILDLMDAGGMQPTILGRSLKEIPLQRVSSARAKRVLGWRAATSLDDGLRATIAWYRAHLAEVT
jgi:CDP-glucose 4,6-dehydratase